MNEKPASIWKRQFFPHLSLFKFLRWLFSGRMIRRHLFCLACLATLIALFYAEENWRGKHAWEKYKREMEAKGEKLDPQAFIPPPVPDDQNFAMTPLLKPLFDYNYEDGRIVWHDTNGFAKATALNWQGPQHRQKTIHALQDWTKGLTIDLKEWQEYYRSPLKPAEINGKPAATITNDFPVAPRPQTPAEDILLALSKFDPELQELRTAIARPYSRFPLHYDEGGGTVLAHLAVLKSVALVLQLRAVADLEVGKSDAAAADVQFALRLADALKTEPFFISQLVRNSIIDVSLQPVWEGLMKRRWSDQQLEAIQKQLKTFDLLADWVWTLEAERALDGREMELSKDAAHQEAITFSDKSDLLLLYVRLAPKGWLYRNELYAARVIQDKLLPEVNVPNQRIYLDLSAANDRALEQAPKNAYNYYVRTCGLPNVPARFGRGQTAINLALVACALERYRLANGQFPETLDALTPRFIGQLPHDIVNGQPLNYHRDEQGKFVLYSVGADGRDDGGTYRVVTKSNQETASYRQWKDNEETGDWVWRYPEK